MGQTRGSLRGRARASVVSSWMEVLRVFYVQWPRTTPGVHVHRHRQGAWSSQQWRAASLPTPKQSLRHHERRAPAWRTDPLIVLGATAGNLVTVAQLSLHLDQVEHVHA